jgi:large subunit ribosomal protein L21
MQRLAGRSPHGICGPDSTGPTPSLENDVTYAIIRVAGKQYRVREGERLLVDRLAQEDGATFAPAVLLVGGDGAPVLSPSDVTVTARVLGAVKGPKVRIGKYKKRTGYRRHTGFRASLTQIEIESIGAKRARAAAKPSAEKEPPKRKAPAPAKAGAVPAGYAGMTVAEIKSAAASWEPEALRAALAYEQENAKRKGAVAALEAAIAHGKDES